MDERSKPVHVSRRPHRALVWMLWALAGPAIAQDAQPPVELSAAEDHARMMGLLGLDELRRGADGDPASRFAANYDESKADAHMARLPDPLAMDDGTRVRTAGDWWSRRRPEIAEHFEREIYGEVPAVLPGVAWRVRSRVEDTIGGVPAIRESVVGVVDNSTYSPVSVEIALDLAIPKDATAPVPAVINLGLDPEFLARLRERFTEEQFAAFSGGAPPWREQVVARGWAAGEYIPTSVQADSGDGLTRGIIGLANGGRPRDPDDWGALRAWAWGAGRVLDYLDDIEAVDASRVAIAGHSRYGKAALVAIAFDARFAAAFISSSGEGGAKLWRRHFGEQIGNIAGAGEYHWVAGNFLRYAGPLDSGDLPVDQHLLIALAAPRGVFIGSGAQGDEWTDPRGMFLAAREASPVYELLGAAPLGGEGMPPVGQGLTRGDIAWRQHDLGHTPGPNWSHFLDFTARQFAKER